jgi:hypothetical protein
MHRFADLFEGERRRIEAQGASLRDSETAVCEWVCRSVVEWLEMKSKEQMA